MESITTELLFFLMATAAVAGLVDAIAGGGGLLTLPALLWAGLPPVQALATNKLQGSFGTLSASIHYICKTDILQHKLWPLVSATFLGAASGTLMVQYLPDELLREVIPLLLVLFSLYFLFSPRVSDEDAAQRLPLGWFALALCFPIGFYDGFFGPGAGSFFVLAVVALLGHNLTQATGVTKILNLTSNLAALLFFALGGHVLWELGLLLGLAQAGGAWLGAHLAVRHGAAVIRPLLVIISLAVSLKLLLT
ncbi:TSUP family transporter [Thiolapillus sp.]